MTYYENFLEIKEINPEEPGLSIEDMEHMAEHIEMTTDGVLDNLDRPKLEEFSVKGTEHYDLTDAQRYLNYALYAQGVIPVTIQGNETVLSSVKDGLVKALQYIKELFQKIWNFLFKKKEPAQQIKEVTLLITNTEKVINTVEFKEKIEVINIGDKLKDRGNRIKEIFEQRIHLGEVTEKKLEEKKIEIAEPSIMTSFKKIKDVSSTTVSVDGIEDPKKAVGIAKNIVNNASKLLAELESESRWYQRKIDIFDTMIENGWNQDRDLSAEKKVTLRENVAGLKAWVTYTSHLTALNTRLIKEVNDMCAFIEKHK